MKFRTILLWAEFRYGFYMCEKGNDLFGHLLTCKSQVNYVLKEGKEDEWRSYRACLYNVFEESETDFIWEDRELIVLEDFEGFDDLFSESDMFFIDSRGDPFEFVSEDGVMIDHLVFIIFEIPHLFITSNWFIIM